MTALANGWYRCSVTRNSIASYAVIGVSDADNAVGSTIGKTIYVWGYQVELGGTVSSYIPTTSAAVTRAQDSPHFPYAASPSAGTLYAKYVAYADGMGNVLGVDDAPVVGGINDTVNIMAPNPYKFYIWSNSGPQVNQEGVVSLNAIHKHAAGWVTGNANSAIDGSILGADVVTTDSPDFVPHGSHLTMGSWAYGGYNFNGWLYEGLYLPRRMTNAELVARST
jgi:hypothetical protein